MRCDSFAYKTMYNDKERKHKNTPKRCCDIFFLFWAAKEHVDKNVYFMLNFKLKYGTHQCLALCKFADLMMKLYHNSVSFSI